MGYGVHEDQAGQPGSSVQFMSREGVLYVCVGGVGVIVDGGSWVRYGERMGEEGRVKCRGEREDRQSVRE